MTRTVEPPAPDSGGPSPRRSTEWADRFVGSDPGLNRFRNALMSVLTIGLILEAEFLFVRHTGALQLAGPRATELSAVEAAKIGAANHEYLVVAMLLGAIVGMISSFGVMDPTARGQLETMLILPVPMIAALVIGIEIGAHRVLALASLAVMLTVGTYLRRFGPRGFISGMLLFMGDFFGFFLHGAVNIGDLGWLTAEIGVGLTVAIAVRFLLFYPNPAKSVARMQRSFGARARNVAALTLESFDDPDHLARNTRRLHRQLIRLNEAALMIDAFLGDPASVGEGGSGELFHQRLFDLELALTNIARFATALGRSDIPSAQCDLVRLALIDLTARRPEEARRHAESLIETLRIGGPVAVGPQANGAVGVQFADPHADRAAVVVAHRFAGSVIAFADAASVLTTLGAAPAADGGEANVVFTPSVGLMGGWLPGSAMVSATASRESGAGWGDRIRLAPYTRTAIQMGVAVGGAIALGDVLSGRRFYWAVIAAFITFMGANNAGEQVRKAVFRVIGTVAGIAIGSGVVSLVGHHTYWSIAVILVSLFFGFYLMRINYAFMVVGITVMVSQLYVQLGEFSHNLLWLRLEETALGSSVAIVVVIVVLPLRTRRVARIAMREHLQAISNLVDHAGARLSGVEPEGAATMRSDARRIDASHQALVTTALPLRRNLLGVIDDDMERSLRLAGASRHYGRNLVLDTETSGPLDPASAKDIARGTAILHTGVETLAAALSGSRAGTYVRSSSIFDQAERRLESQLPTLDRRQLAVRDLKLIDGAMASLAEQIGLQISDFDTTELTGQY